MEKVVLKSMTDYIAEQEQAIPLISDVPKVKDMDRIFVQRIILYMRFLKQILEIWMFVPAKLVNGVWVVLKPVIQMDYIPFEDRPTKFPQECYEQDLKEYEEALECVLFEGFEIKGEYLVISDVWLMLKKEIKNFNIENLITDFDDIDLVLTESARKQIGL